EIQLARLRRRYEPIQVERGRLAWKDVRVIGVTQGVEERFENARREGGEELRVVRIQAVGVDRIGRDVQEVARQQVQFLSVGPHGHLPLHTEEGFGVTLVKMLDDGVA